MQEPESLSMLESSAMRKQQAGTFVMMLCTDSSLAVTQTEGHRQLPPAQRRQPDTQPGWEAQ